MINILSIILDTTQSILVFKEKNNIFYYYYMIKLGNQKFMCMKNMKTSIYYFLLIALPLFIISCSKEGPAGPAGPTGPTGATGAAGPGGPAGAPGTANVIYSAWLDVPFLPDTVKQGNVVIDTLGYYSDVAVPKLTPAILT